MIIEEIWLVGEHGLSVGFEKACYPFVENASKLLDVLTLEVSLKYETVVRTRQALTTYDQCVLVRVQHDMSNIYPP